MQSPKISKCILNTGIGKRAVVDRKQIIPALLAMETISGQRPMITRAKESVDKFKSRENMPIGCKVTLRKKKLDLFLDRLVNLVLPKPGLEELTKGFGDWNRVVAAAMPPSAARGQSRLEPKGLKLPPTNVPTTSPHIGTRELQSFQFSPLTRETEGQCAMNLSP